MSTVGSANVEITADDRPARGKISGFVGFLKQTSKIATGVMAGLAFFEGVSRGINAAKDSTIGANAAMEQYQNTLAVVLKDSKKAAETLAWAEKFAAKTPFEIPDVVEATVRLESYGLSAQKVLQTTGDMAAVMGKPLMQAVEAVADAQTGELERLKEFGITKDMLIEKSAEMGKKEVVNAKGQITDMEAFNEALFALMEERYKGGMEIQSKTFNGMISNVKDSVGTIARELSKQMFEGLKKRLESIVPIMSGVTQLIKGDVAGFSETVTQSFGQEKGLKIMKFFFALQEGAKKAGEAFNITKEFVKALFALFKGNEGRGTSILHRLGLSPGEIQQILNAINLIKKYIQAFIEVTIMRFQTMSKFIIDAWKVIWPYIQPLIQQIVQFIQSKLEQVVAFWNQYGGQITTAVQNAFNLILSIIKFVMPAVLFIIESIWKNIEGVINGALNIILGLVKIFTGLFTGDFKLMWDGIKQLFIGAIEFVWNLMSLLFIGRILGGIKAFVTQGVAKSKEFWMKVAEIFRNLDNEVAKIVGSLVSKVIGYFKNYYTQGRQIFDTAKVFGVRTFQAMKDAIVGTARKLVDDVLGKFTSFKNRISTTFDDLLSKAKYIFNKVGEAIARPVDEARSRISNAVEKIKSIFGAIKLTLPKIKTPSFKLLNWSKNPLNWIKAMPTIDVQWNALGGIFTKPTIFNTPMGLQGFGEAGPEAAIPLTKKVLGTIGAMISSTMPGGNGIDLSGLIEAIFTLAGRPVIVELEGREIAREIHEDVTEFQGRARG